MSDQVTKSPGISRWREVGETLMREIDHGVLAPGDKLPAEFDLAERFGVARQTVRRALSHLRSEGLIDVQLGRGTFVSNNVFQYRIAANKTFEENLLESAMAPSRYLLRLERQPAAVGIAAQLGVEIDSPILFALTVNRANDIPVVLGRVYLPSERLPGLDEELTRIASTGESFSLADVIAKSGVARFRRSFIRLKSRLPSTEETQLLELSPLETVVETRSVSENPEGEPVFFSIMSYRGSSVEFFIGPEAFAES